MPTVSFEDLQVSQLAETLADDVWSIVIAWDAFARDTVGKQIVKAADSIGANIAEGTGRGSYQDNRRFIRIARGSLYETRHWLRRVQAKALERRTDKQAKIDHSGSFTEAERVSSFNWRCFTKSQDQ